MIKNNFHVFFLNIDLALLCVLNYLIRLILGRLHEKVYNRWKSILLQEFQHQTMEYNSILWVSTLKEGRGRKVSSEFTQYRIINRFRAATHSAALAQLTSGKMV